MDIEDVRRLVARHAEPGTSEPLDDVFLSREIQPGAPQLSTTGIGFALIVQGAKQLTLGTQTVNYGPGEYLVTSVDLPVVGRFTEASADQPALGLGMTLDPVEVAELLLTSGSARHAEEKARKTAPPALLVGRAEAELIDAIARLLRLLDRPADLAVLGPMVRREVLWLLLTGPQGETIRQLGLADSKLTPVSQAVQWIRANPAAPLRIDELAARVGLSTSAFHRTFRAVTGSSPLQFQKQLRLHTARQLLTTGARSVSQIAIDVGYQSATQFNREYRRLFGNPPGRDRLVMQTLRATPSSPTSRPTNSLPSPPGSTSFSDTSIPTSA